MTEQRKSPPQRTFASPTLIEDVRKAIGREDISVADLLRAGLYRLLGSSVDEAVEQAKVPMGRPVGSKTRR